MICPCGEELEWPLSPEDLHDHRQHFLGDEDGKQLRISFSSRSRDQAPSIGFGFGELSN